MPETTRFTFFKVFLTPYSHACMFIKSHTARCDGSVYKPTKEVPFSFGAHIESPAESVNLPTWRSVAQEAADVLCPQLWTETLSEDMKREWVSTRPLDRKANRSERVQIALSLTFKTRGLLYCIDRNHITQPYMDSTLMFHLCHLLLHLL